MRETLRNVLIPVKVTSDIQTQNKSRIHWSKGTEPPRCDCSVLCLPHSSPIPNLPHRYRLSPRQPAIVFKSLHNQRLILLS